MKEIRMDFDTYEEVLANEYISGFNNGISKVMKWLESGKSLYDFLEPEDPILLESHWGRIAKALGREDELRRKDE